MEETNKIRTYLVNINPKVERFIINLNPEESAKASRALGLLEELGPGLREPHVKHVRGKLWELRFSVRRKYFRLLYHQSGPREYTVLHGILKGKNSLADDDIRTAERRMDNGR